MATKITTGLIDSGAITSALITDASITADDLHTTLDLTGKTVTVATATAGDNDTSVASTAFVSTAIANLADSAPSTLDTLNELAAALGDDANYATTTTNAIATKLPLAGGTLTGNIAHASDLTLDVGGNIVLDADGGGVYFKDAGTNIGFFQNDGGDFRMISAVNDKDIKFLGNDGGSTITALTLDMSDAGSAIFNHDVVLADNGRVLLGSSSDLQLVHDGSNSYIDDAGTGILYVRGNNKIILGKYTGETMVEANVDGAVELYYDNAKKLETTSTGITVTGSNSVDGYIGQFTQANTSNGDGVKVQIGSAAASEYAFDVRSNAGSTQIISAKGDGKVGIGVASPVTGLTVASSTNITQQPLATSGTTISWNALTHANAYLVPAANLTIDLPTNPIEGAIISVEIAMNGTPRTIAWHTVFEFAASTAPTATATANKTDIFTFRYNGAVWQEIGRVQNMAQT